jgi:hypothetical protein
MNRAIHLRSSCTGRGHTPQGPAQVQDRQGLVVRPGTRQIHRHRSTVGAGRERTKKSPAEGRARGDGDNGRESVLVSTPVLSPHSSHNGTIRRRSRPGKGQRAGVASVLPPARGRPSGGDHRERAGSPVARTAPVGHGRQSPQPVGLRPWTGVKATGGRPRKTASLPATPGAPCAPQPGQGSQDRLRLMGARLRRRDPGGIHGMPRGSTGGGSEAERSPEAAARHGMGTSPPSTPGQVPGRRRVSPEQNGSCRASVRPGQVPGRAVACAGLDQPSRSAAQKGVAAIARLPGTPAARMR